MENIVVFKASPPYRDGGSRDEICTNVGIFSLIKKLKNPGNRNGFYIGGLKASEQLSSELEVALSNFLSKDESYSIDAKVDSEIFGMLMELVKVGNPRDRQKLDKIDFKSITFNKTENATEKN